MSGIITDNVGRAGGLVKAAAAAGITLGTEQATTSGTTWTFGSIPAGTKRISLHFSNVSTSDSTATFLVEIGDAGGLETSGYNSDSKYHEGTSIAGQGQSTAAFAVCREQYGTSAIINGTVTFQLEDASDFTWVMTANLHHFGTGASWAHGGKSLSAELTQLKLSGFTGDAGAVNITYE